MKENPYANLRRLTHYVDDGKSLTAPIMIHGYETLTIYDQPHGRDFVAVRVGLHNGRYLAGLAYRVGSLLHSNYLPSWRHMDFDSRKDAILYTLGSVLAKLSNEGDARAASALNAVRAALFQEQQQTLF